MLLKDKHIFYILTKEILHLRYVELNLENLCILGKCELKIFFIFVIFFPEI